MGDRGRNQYYSRSLAATEISAIYNSGAGGKCLAPSAPIITVQPQDVTSAAGTNATFTVGVAGSAPLSYRWLFQGTNLPAGTNYVLTVPNVQLSSTGNYQAVITNAYGAVTSAVAMLFNHLPSSIASRKVGPSISVPLPNWSSGCQELSRSNFSGSETERI